MHFAPVGDPAGEAADGEEYGEHRHGNANRAVDDAGIEIDVRIEFALDEVFVAEGHFLQLAGDVEDGVVDVPLVEQPLAHGLDDRRARVEIFVDSVTKAHQPEAARLVLGHVDVFLDVAAVFANLLEHGNAGFIRPAVEWPPQGADSRRNGRK